MNRRTFLITPLACFSALAPAQSSSGIINGSCKIGGGLSKLTHKGKPIGNLLYGSNLLIYFTTAHKTPGCSADLLTIENAAQQIKGSITPVIIYPEPDREDRSNLMQYIERASSPFIGLTGPKDVVISIARTNFRAYYDRNLNAHSRFIYLMDAKGNNLAIIAGAEILSHKIAQIDALLKSENAAFIECDPKPL